MEEVHKVEVRSTRGWMGDRLNKERDGWKQIECGSMGGRQARGEGEEEM